VICKTRESSNFPTHVALVGNPARTSVRVSVQKLKSVLYNSFGEDFVLCQCWVFNSVACSGVCRCAWKVVTLNSEVLCGCLSVCVLDEGCLGVLVESSALWIWFGRGLGDFVLVSYRFEPKAAARATMSATTISNGGKWCEWGCVMLLEVWMSGSADAKLSGLLLWIVCIGSGTPASTFRSRIFDVHVHLSVCLYRFSCRVVLLFECAPTWALWV